MGFQKIATVHKDRGEPGRGRMKLSKMVTFILFMINAPMMYIYISKYKYISSISNSNYRTTDS